MYHANFVKKVPSEHMAFSVNHLFAFGFEPRTLYLDWQKFGTGRWIFAYQNWEYQKYQAYLYSINYTVCSNQLL